MRLLSGLIFVILVVCSGCDNEFDIHGQGEPIPVVYCLLNPLEDTQSIRVGKSFTLTKEQVESGTIPQKDSMTWPIDAEVYLERWENDFPVETIPFELKNDAVVDNGFFPQESYLIYQSKLNPQAGEEYHLFVYFPEIDKIVSGSCTIVSRPTIIDPELVPGRTVSFDTISPYNIRWYSRDYKGIYQGVFKVNFSECVNDVYELKHIFFPTQIFMNQSDQGIIEKSIRGKSFLISMAEQIDPKDDVIRELINFEYIFYSGGSELALLVDNDMGDNNPFTFNQNASNVDGGIGVLSSLTIERFPNLVPSVITKYFLATSDLTVDLGFKEE